ncbi:MAG: Rieske 2Fe-2S domain-containing protein [Bauldia sp.]
MTDIGKERTGLRDRADAAGRAVGRRDIVKGLGAACLCMAAPPVLAQDDPASVLPKPGDFIVAARDKTKALTVNDIPLSSAALEAWSQDPASGVVRSGSAQNRLLLFRFEEKDLSPAALANSAKGVVAFTIVCTHSGCEVTDWVPDERLLECPCHFSRYDPRDNANVIQGPATRHLPVLALKADDGGKLVVAKAFDSRVGFDSN